jgi:hypothetical protein
MTPRSSPSPKSRCLEFDVADADLLALIDVVDQIDLPGLARGLGPGSIFASRYPFVS